MQWDYGYCDGTDIEVVEVKMTPTDIKELHNKIQSKLEVEDPSYKPTNLTEIGF